LKKYDFLGLLCQKKEVDLLKLTSFYRFYL